MIVYPDGSVTGSVNVAELEEIHKAQQGMTAEDLAAIGPVESLAQLLGGLTAPEPEPEQPEPEPEAPAGKKGK